MKFRKYLFISIIGLFCAGCADDSLIPGTEEEEDPIIIGDPDLPLPDGPNAVYDTVYVT